MMPSATISYNHARMARMSQCISHEPTSTLHHSRGAVPSGWLIADTNHTIHPRSSSLNDASCCYGMRSKNDAM